MQFGLQKPIFTFDYRGDETSQIIDSIENLATSAENKGFDSFWVMDHFHQIPMIGKPEEPMLESWTTLSVLAGLTTKIKLGTLVSSSFTLVKLLNELSTIRENFNPGKKTIL